MFEYETYAVLKLLCIFFLIPFRRFLLFEYKLGEVKIT